MKHPPVAVALVHHPVVDRRGERVTTAVTNLDIHDIARTARTFGITRFYVITPVAEQQALVERLLGHWRQGFGATYNPDRSEALGLVETASSIEEALTRWETATGEPSLPVLTGARRTDGITFARCRALSRSHSLVIIFGTGWGLAPCLFERGWVVLDPVAGSAEYNHLPVRAAAAIILDRLFGRGQN
jgi:hypothetical protein